MQRWIIYCNVGRKPISPVAIPLLHIPILAWPLGVSFAMLRYLLYCLYEGLSQTMSDTICVYKSEEANWCDEVNVRGRIGTLESYVVVWCYYWKRVGWDAIK